MENTDLFSGIMGEYIPPAKFHFRVDFPLFPNPNGFGFQEVDGFGVEFETQIISEGGLNTYSHKVPGKVSYTNLVLKRGLVNMSSPISVWFKLFMDMGVNGILGIAELNNLKQLLNISLLDEDGLPVMVWTFVDAFPVKWTFGDMNSTDDSTVMIEEMEFAYSYFFRIL